MLLFAAEFNLWFNFSLPRYQLSTVDIYTSGHELKLHGSSFGLIIVAFSAEISVGLDPDWISRELKIQLGFISSSI